MRGALIFRAQVGALHKYAFGDAEHFHIEAGFDLDIDRGGFVGLHEYGPAPLFEPRFDRAQLAHAGLHFNNSLTCHGIVVKLRVSSMRISVPGGATMVNFALTEVDLDDGARLDAGLAGLPALPDLSGLAADLFLSVRAGLGRSRPAGVCAKA